MYGYREVWRDVRSNVKYTPEVTGHPAAFLVSSLAFSPARSVISPQVGRSNVDPELIHNGQVIVFVSSGASLAPRRKCREFDLSCGGSRAKSPLTVSEQSAVPPPSARYAVAPSQMCSILQSVRRDITRRVAPPSKTIVAIGIVQPKSKKKKKRKTVDNEISVIRKDTTITEKKNYSTRRTIFRTSGLVIVSIKWRLFELNFGS